ncbi:MAG: hypothetical protein KF901_02645 [Myxococcales bacterium]|nr:hypothetical protein [Myxococcales bacterium]
MPPLLPAPYDVFARYPRRHAMHACPCCVNDDDRRALTHAPLRELTDRQLARFAFKAMTTWGELDDYRHFLPRILELHALGAPFPGYLTHVIAGKLRRGELARWPNDEREAVTSFLRQVQLRSLTITPELDSPVVGQLDELADLFDVRLVLDAWADDASEPAALHLAWALLEARRRPPRCDALRSWLRATCRRETLARARAKASSTEVQGTLDRASAVLAT